MNRKQYKSSKGCRDGEMDKIKLKNKPEDNWGGEILGKSSELESRVIVSLLNMRR